jgi:hypothetical protein
LRNHALYVVWQSGWRHCPDQKRPWHHAATLHDAFLAKWPRAAAMLAYSGYPLTDYPLALLVAMNFFAAAHAHCLGKLLVAIFAATRIVVRP